MNRREILKVIASALPFGLASKLLGNTVTPKVSDQKVGHGIWGVVCISSQSGMFCFISQEMCINDFIRRAFKLYPQLKTAKQVLIDLYFGEEDAACWGALKQTHTEPFPFFDRFSVIQLVKTSINLDTQKTNHQGWCEYVVEDHCIYYKTVT